MSHSRFHRRAARATTGRHSAACHQMPHFVEGETALETYDRMDMGVSTNVAIAAIVTHYRQFAGGCSSSTSPHLEGAP